MCVISLCAKKSVSARSGSRTSLGATTSVPPTSSDMHSSQNATSKLTEANPTTRLSSVTPQRPVAVAISPGTPAWVTATPFGVPVEPDV